MYALQSRVSRRSVGNELQNTFRKDVIAAQALAGNSYLACHYLYFLVGSLGPQPSELPTAFVFTPCFFFPETKLFSRPFESYLLHSFDGFMLCSLAAEAELPQVTNPDQFASSLNRLRLILSTTLASISHTYATLEIEESSCF